MSEINEKLGDSKVALDWVGSLGLDIAKATAGLFLLGTFVSVLYYSRFSILPLDYTRAQSIMVGMYVVILYVFLPGAALRLLKVIKATWLVITTFIVLLAAVDLVIFLLLNTHHWIAFLGLITMVFLQTSCFMDFTSFNKSISIRGAAWQIRLVPARTWLITCLLLSSVHFSLLLFSHMPGFLGGGEPAPVKIFTSTPDLLSVKYAAQSISSKGKYSDYGNSYGMKLLYESDKDEYFLTQLTANGVVLENVVIRVHKDQIARIDYITPKWVSWR